MTLYRFVWSSFLGYPLQIPKGAIVEALIFGRRRAVLVSWDGRLFITDRYALRKIDVHNGDTGRPARRVSSRRTDRTA